MQLGGIVLQQSWGDGVNGGAEIHKQDTGVGFCRVQVLEDEMLVLWPSLLNRVGQSVNESSGPWFFGDGDDDGGFEACWYVACLQ